MSFKYYNKLGLLESFMGYEQPEVQEAEQERTPLRDLSNRLGLLFQTNFPLLKSIMNRFRAMPPEEFQAKIPVVMNAIKQYTPGEADPFDVFQSINKVLDEGSNNNVVKIAPSINAPAQDRRQNGRAA